MVPKKHLLQRLLAHLQVLFNLSGNLTLLKNHELDQFKKEKNIAYEIKKIYNDNWISRIFLIRGIANFRKGNINNGTNDFIKAIDIYPKIGPK